MDNKQLYLDILEQYGEDVQIDMMIEEMAELTQALLKLRRSKKEANQMIFKDPLLQHSYLVNVFEEMADVKLMLNQMIVMFEKEDEFEFENQYSYKLNRLNRIIKKIR